MIDILFNKKFLMRFVVTVGIALVAVGYVVFTFQFSSRASATNIVDSTALAEGSTVTQDAELSDFNLHKNKGYLLKTKSQGDAAVVEFLNKDPQYGSQRKKLIPDDFIQNSVLERRTDDSALNAKHYFYDQKLDGVPVFGSNLSVHIKNKNEVYSVEGNLTLSETVTPERITEDQAREVALQQARIDSVNREGDIIPLYPTRQAAAPAAVLTIEEVTRYIVNKKVMGIGEDATNYLTAGIIVRSENPLFIRRYFVSLTDGAILFTQPLLFQALNRNIYNCTGTSSRGTCITKVRAEGSVESGDVDTNRAYDLFGEVYTYHKNVLGRDSYDNAGASMDAHVHTNGFDECPNAYWYGVRHGQGSMYYCNNMVLKDITAHEFMHGVTFNTADLTFYRQSGALNESISDIFAYAIDSANWTIAEESEIGVIRRMDDPPNLFPNQININCTAPYAQNPNGGCHIVDCNTGLPNANGQCLSYRDADRLFSPSYYCGDQDDGGVHHNSGVMNKAFYLMTVGGNFNGCSVTGITKEKSLPIVYRALTTYLSSSSNFKDMYNALEHACNDLYPSEINTTCAQVKKAAQATEMDQQPAGEQVGALCSNKIRVQPTCVVVATATPIPVATATPLPTATPVPAATATVTPAITTPVLQQAQLKFNVKLPDVASTVTTIPAGDVVIEIFDGTRGVISMPSQHNLVRNGNYFVGDMEIDLSDFGPFPADNRYQVGIKVDNTLRRIFNNVTLVMGSTIDCTVVANADCGELITKRDEKILFSGDSDGFGNTSGSYNKIDSADLFVLAAHFNTSASTNEKKLVDFNKDGQVNIRDLEIFGRNYQRQGD